MILKEIDKYHDNRKALIRHLCWKKTVFAAKIVYLTLTSNNEQNLNINMNSDPRCLKV